MPSRNNLKDSLKPVPEFSKKILVVEWFSGLERIDLEQILESLAQPAPADVVTMELRGDGRVVQYVPHLQRIDDGSKSFSLIYADGGKYLMDGAEVGDGEGYTGTATYNCLGGDKWECRWKGKDGVEIPDVPCSFANEKTSRLMQVCFRALRDATFRKRILKTNGRCPITLEDEKSVLEAAHVLGVSDGGSDHDDNGIVLRRDLHALFDAHILTLDSEGLFSMDPVPASYKNIFIPGKHRLDDATLKLVRENIEERNRYIEKNRK